MPVPFDPPLDASEVLAAFTDRYTNVQAIKAGGQGAVFKCIAKGTPGYSAGALVALKIYSADHLEERTVREVETLKQLRVKTLVRFVGTGQCQLRGKSCVWLETGYIQGESLGEKLKRGPLTLPEVVAIVSDAAIGIDSLWSKRIVHRDIKPENIMVQPDGRAVLIDLGLARHLDLASLTGQGLVVGTIGYCSPEQANGARNLSCKSDVFALGLVAQQSLLGHHPSNGSQMALLKGGTMTGTLIPGLPLEVMQTLDAMLNYRAFLRPSPAKVAERLLPFTRRVT